MGLLNAIIKNIKHNNTTNNRQKSSRDARTRISPVKQTDKVTTAESEYQIIASLDEITCEKCGRMDLKKFKDSEYEEGKTSPPFHDGCRCSTAPYFPPDEIDRMFPEHNQRTARDPASKEIYYVNGNTSYKKWKETLSDEQLKAIELHKEQEKRKDINHEEYKIICSKLPDVAPKSFAGYMRMKNSNSKNYIGLIDKLDNLK